MVAGTTACVVVADAEVKIGFERFESVTLEAIADVDVDAAVVKFVDVEFVELDVEAVDVAEVIVEVAVDVSVIEDEAVITVDVAEVMVEVAEPAI